MSANNYHRLNWPRVLCWLLKMDAYGGLPEWWQWFIPRWGNWGGPGWSAGRWCNDPGMTDWDVPAIDDMDMLCKRHDHAYQSGESWLDADAALLIGLESVTVDGLWPRFYRVGAIVAFSLMVCRMSLFGDKRREIDHLR
jgi:hypothetical protein